MNVTIRGIQRPLTIRARLLRGGSPIQVWDETTLSPSYAPPPPPSVVDTATARFRTLDDGGDGAQVPDLSTAYITISRVTGPAPLGVTFQVRFPSQAHETAFIMFGTAVCQFSENAAESYEFQYLTERLAGETAGSAIGPFAGHVYVTPGAHEWSVTLYYPGLAPRTITASGDGGQLLFDAQPAVGQVVVTNQNDWFDDEATPRTRYFSPTAYASQSAMRTAMAAHYPAAASAPLSHFHYGSVTALKACIDAVPENVGSRPWRVLIEAGTTTTITADTQVPIEIRNVTLDRIGTGADPIITVSPDFTMTLTEANLDNAEGPGIFRNSDNTDNRLLNTFGINNINFVGLYDPAAPGAGVRLDLYLIPIQILTSSGPRCAQIFRVRSNNWQYNLFYAGANRGMVIADCNFDEWYNYGMWVAAPGPENSLADSAIVGVSAKQKPATINGKRWDTPDTGGGNGKRSHMGAAPFTDQFSWALEPSGGPVKKDDATVIPAEETPPSTGGWDTVSAWWKANWRLFNWASVNSKALDRQLFGTYLHCAIHGPIRQPWPGIRAGCHQIELRSLNGWGRSGAYNDALPWDEQVEWAYQVQPCWRLAAAAPKEGKPHSPSHAQSYWRIHAYGGEGTFQQQGQQAPADWTADEYTLGVGQIFDGIIIEAGRLPTATAAPGFGFTIQFGNVAVRNSVLMELPGSIAPPNQGRGYYHGPLVNTRCNDKTKQAGPNSAPAFSYHNTMIWARDNPTGIFPSAFPFTESRDAMRPLYEWGNAVFVPATMETVTEPEAFTSTVDTSAALGDIDVAHRPASGSDMLGRQSRLVPAFDADGSARTVPAALGAFEVPPPDVTPPVAADLSYDDPDVTLIMSEPGDLLIRIDSNATDFWADNPTGFRDAVVADASGWNVIEAVTSGSNSIDISAVDLAVGDYSLHVLARDASGNLAASVISLPITLISAPAQMSAPTVTAAGSDSISVDRAAAPSDGNSAITSYDLRWSTDEATWTTVTGITDPQTVSSLTAETLYYVQTRAVNAIGAGPWSASGSATTATAGTDLAHVGSVKTVVAPTFGADVGVTACALPTTSEGDTVFLFLACDDRLYETITADGTTNGLVAGQGWTVLAVGSDANPGLLIAHKRMGSTPDTTVNVESIGSRSITVGAMAYSGVDPSTPIDATPVVRAGSSGNCMTWSYTPVTAGATLVACAFMDDAIGQNIPPAGYTARLSFSTTDGDTLNSVSMTIATKDDAPASLETSQSFTGTNNDVWKCYLFAIRPAA